MAHSVSPRLMDRLHADQFALVADTRGFKPVIVQLRQHPVWRVEREEHCFKQSWEIHIINHVIEWSRYLLQIREHIRHPTLRIIAVLCKLTGLKQHDTAHLGCTYTVETSWWLPCSSTYCSKLTWSWRLLKELVSQLCFHSFNCFFLGGFLGGKGEIHRPTYMEVGLNDPRATYPPPV